MKQRVYRIYAEKKPQFDGEGKSLRNEFTENLSLAGVENVRVIHRYDIEGVTEQAYQQARNTIFSEPPVDIIHDEILPETDERIFAWEYLPGQYDQRADSAAQGVQILTHGEKSIVKSAVLVAVKGNVSDEDWKRIKAYVINPVDSREAVLEKPVTLEQKFDIPEDVAVLNGFIDMDEKKLSGFLSGMGFAMDLEDLLFCQAYFRSEKRDPTQTELRIIDTYWSDHCRHTTFLTEIDNISINEGFYKEVFDQALTEYQTSRQKVHGGRKPQTLMDLATIAMKELKMDGKISDLDESEEINACSIVVPVDVNGKNEDWLVMFKNETHNHPTEIEPFGGAATCIGGAIRDPLSGRSFVYQAMRVTGSGDPRTPIEKTMKGKLSQRKITTGAAHGYSSYGNQIGLSTGMVSEIYDEGYTAKRMEIGAVIGAAPKSHVRRERPEVGDMILLLGGRTGRDGCGGATGSSKVHTEESVSLSGAEVQKGNAPEERKLQRLFRSPDVTKLIKRCNDFGAGGVSVAIGELADGLSIHLDAVPKKYEGLDGTELAISESQERMAVVIAKKDVKKMMEYAALENLEAAVVAEVTREPVMTMTWRNKTIVSLKRGFLNSNGAKKHTSAEIISPDPSKSPFNHLNSNFENKPLKEAWKEALTSLNAGSQKGLGQRFDSNIGAASVLMPFGGKYQLTPSEAMAAKIPMLGADTTTASVMSWGFDPLISRWSPFHGALYAVVDSLARIAATGSDASRTRLTFQEYFERLRKEPARWGRPLAALLGAYSAQKNLSIPSIGGKDSMSGSFNELDVPPTLVSFAVNITDTRKLLSNELKQTGSSLVYLPLQKDDNYLPLWNKLISDYKIIHELSEKGKLLSVQPVRGFGIAEAVSKMAFGNKIGFEFSKSISRKELFGPDYGSLVIETTDADALKKLESAGGILLGKTIAEASIKIEGENLPLEKLIADWSGVLAGIFPETDGAKVKDVADYIWEKPCTLKRIKSIVRPRVLVTAFPGTNSEYDTGRAFEKAGAEVEIFVFRNRTPQDLSDSLKEMKDKIKKSQIVVVPGGFSAGDEPEGSGKFIAAVYRNPGVRDSVMELLKKRDGLMLGICNGFQALIKLGLVPYGEIRDMEDASPTLSYNTIGRHVACMVRTKIVSRQSPWFGTSKLGDVHLIPVSHGEGRFIAGDEVLSELKANGQIATQYVDLDGHAADSMPDNPNGSFFAVEGITSPDGRVLGKMGHSERISDYVAKNIEGNKYQRIFEAGVKYFE